MKQILLLLSFLIITSCTQAQKPDTNIKPRPIPPFRVMTTDSAWFTPANIKKGKPVVVIYFSPDCSHCQRMMYELKPKLAAIKNVQVIMITWSANYDIHGIREFKRDYDLKKYPNFILGTEGYTRQVQTYYDVHTTPYVALYNSQQKWVKAFDKVTKSEEILASIKALK
jgi:thiol-disulfide isomerase/thioredoxin